MWFRYTLKMFVLGLIAYHALDIVHPSVIVQSSRALSKVKFFLTVYSTLPFRFYLVNFGIPLGSHTIKPALARHTGVQVSLVPANIGTYHIQPTGVHGLCFGYCFSGPLPLRSLILGPPILALKLSVSFIITPVDCHTPYTVADIPFAPGLSIDAY